MRSVINEITIFAFFRENDLLTVTIRLT